MTVTTLDEIGAGHGDASQVNDVIVSIEVNIYGTESDKVESGLGPSTSIFKET